MPHEQRVSVFLHAIGRGERFSHAYPIDYRLKVFYRSENTL